MEKVKVKTSREQPEVTFLEQKPGRTAGEGSGRTRPGKDLVAKSDESKNTTTDSKKNSSTRGTKKSGVTKTPPKQSEVQVKTTLGVKRPSASVSSPVTSKKATVKVTATTKDKTKARTSTKKKSKVVKKKFSRGWIFCPDDFGPLYQFKIELLGSHPLIWRQIQVPADFNFHRLHLAIQSAMGWKDCHSHVFEMYDLTRIGTPLPETPTMSPLDENVELIAGRFDLFHPFNNKIMYEYDFGDGWKHMITLERTLQSTRGQLYPACVDGKLACPPENVGGLEGFKNFLKILKNKKHGEYEDMKAWAEVNGWGGRPSHFKPSECQMCYW